MLSASKGKRCDAEDGRRPGPDASDGDQLLVGATAVVNNGDTEAHFTEAYLVGDVDSGEASISDVRVIGLGRAPGSGDLLGASLRPIDGWDDWWNRAEPVDSAILAPGNAAAVIIALDSTVAGDLGPLWVGAKSGFSDNITLRYTVRRGTSGMWLCGTNYFPDNAGVIHAENR